jgi:hypothetical protein
VFRPGHVPFRPEAFDSVVSASRRTFTLLTLAGLGGAALWFLPAASASAVPDPTPALAATGTDSLRLVWRGTGPDRLTDQVSTGGRWGDPAPFAGARPAGETSGVGLGADPATGAVVSAAVADEQVWVRTAPGGGWSSLGGSATGAPAVAALGGGAFAVVVRDDTGTVKARFLRTGKWGPWSTLGGDVTTSPAAAGRNGSLVIAAAGRNRKVRTTVVTGGKPTGWRTTGIVSTATPGLAAEPGTGTLHLITRNADLTPSARVSADGARTWGKATRLDGRLGSGIAATSRAPGTADIAALALDGQAVQSSLRSDRWGGFRLAAASSTTVLPEDALTAVTGDPAGTRTLTFAEHARLPRPGEILAATTTPATPDGLLVKVTSIAGRTAKADPARLTEAVPEGVIDQTITLGATVQPIKQKVPCTNGVPAEITGSVTITPSFDLKAAWNAGDGVSELSFTGTLTEDARLRTSIGGGATCTLPETSLLAQPVRFQPVVFAVGAVPVVITPELRLSLDATGSVQAALTAGAGQTASVKAGLVLRNGTVGPVGTLSNTYTYGPPTVTGTATARTGVNASFDFLMYGAEGPRLRTRAHVAVDAPNWKLTAGMTAGVRLVVSQLGVHQSKDDVLSSSKTLATSADTPPAGSATTITTNRTRPRIGDTITISGKVTYGDGTPVRDGALSVAWHSPSRTGKGTVTNLRTTPDGAYTLTVKLDEKGEHSFSAHFPGSTPNSNGSRASVTLTVSG